MTTFNPAWIAWILGVVGVAIALASCVPVAVAGLRLMQHAKRIPDAQLFRDLPQFETINARFKRQNAELAVLAQRSKAAQQSLRESAEKLRLREVATALKTAGMAIRLLAKAFH